MSAYVVSHLHINVLVTWASMGRGRLDRSFYWRQRRRPFAGDEPRVASVLYAENVRSVNARYKQADAAHGFVFRFENARAMSMSPVAIIRACHCLAYQSCEAEGWEDSEAFAILRGIEDGAMRALPGYDTAPTI